jgi:CRISPR-associated endonuclease Cas2
MRWIIAYDIRKGKKRRAVARQLEAFGFRRQKSVFEGEASPDDVAKLLDQLAEGFQPGVDMVTAWPVTENGPARVVHRGRPQDQVRRGWMVL